MGSLWLARAIYELGGIEFGDFTFAPATVNSPIYLNPKVLIANPGALRTASSLIRAALNSRIAMRNPGCGPFDLIAGVPFGGSAHCHELLPELRQAAHLCKVG